jgi:hypothetical protein
VPLFAPAFVVDHTCDMLLSDRPYRKAWSREMALAQLRSQRAVQVDPKVVVHFLALVPQASDRRERSRLWPTGRNCLLYLPVDERIIRRPEGESGGEREKMHKNPILLAMVAVCIAILSCTAPTGQSVQGVVEQTLTAVALTSAAAPGTATPSTATLEPGATASPSATACTATVTANLNANVRKGPGTVYDAVGALLAGQSATVAGQNAAGTWWYIVFAAGPGGYAWIAGSTVTPSCLPASVAVVAAPPTPLPASGSCKGDYVWRLIKSSDKVCVPPASKAQADADNAAASGRLCTATYGPDTCAQGYVWRDAFTNDHVCVTGATRSQAAADNAAAASRWVSGAYGPHTCIAGYVWREATGDQSDDVCVTPDIRTQAASDNSAAASRLCTATYGPDTCAQGYVWREAFTNDHVCVTTAVRDATAADNADASNHTWP